MQNASKEVLNGVQYKTGPDKMKQFSYVITAYILQEFNFVGSIGRFCNEVSLKYFFILFSITAKAEKNKLFRYIRLHPIR